MEYFIFQAKLYLFCKGVYNEICKQNIALAYSFAYKHQIVEKRYLNSYNTSFDDIVQICSMRLSRTCDLLDPKKGRLSTYAHNMMFGGIAHLIRYNKQKRRVPHDAVVSLDIPCVNLDRSENAESYYETILAKDYVAPPNYIDLYNALDKLSERQQKVFNLFLQGYSKKEIAKLVGLSGEHTTRVFNEGIRFLREELKEAV